MLFVWRTGSKLIRETRKREELKWARDLAAMLQVSITGYASAGTFLGLAYFDLYYHVIALMILCKVVVAKELARFKKAEGDVVDESATRNQQYGELPTTNLPYR